MFYDLKILERPIRSALVLTIALLATPFAGAQELIDPAVRADILKRADGRLAHIETEYNDIFVTKHGAELVIHGHGHEERIDRLNGPRGPMLIVAVPSASYREPGRAGWNQYRVFSDGAGWRLEVATRRTVPGGFTTTSTETVTWGAPVSRATAPTSR